MALSSGPKPPQHHEHQLQWRFPKAPNRPSIMSISCNGAFPMALSRGPEAPQHHEHQLQWHFAKAPNRPSITCISCNGVLPRPQTAPASSTSAAMALCHGPPPPQHHEHQLQWRFPKAPNRPSIMSISCNGAFPRPQTAPAS